MSVLGDRDRPLLAGRSLSSSGQPGDTFRWRMGDCGLRICEMKLIRYTGKVVSGRKVGWYRCEYCNKRVARRQNKDSCGCQTISLKRATVYRPQPAERSCLMCGKNFISRGPHNRRCPVCEHKIEHSGQAYYMPPVHGVHEHSTIACCWET